MSLYRQLVIFTFVLFFFLFAGTWVAKLESTRSFLNAQLISHSQDTATSLALSISPHVAKHDMVTVEGMINAMFDGGYYRIVRFIDPNNQVLIDRVLEVKIEDVPPWFIRLIPLKAPGTTADVMAGWNQGGTIYIESHPGYAYKTLWSDAVKITIWFAACAVFVFIAGGLGLRVLLKPLLLVEKQADALCKREYRVQEPLPWTKEFRKVVEAMNRMTNKVKEMFEEQATQAEGLRERAYNDPLTGLGNRRYFESQIIPRLGQQEITPKGGVMIVRVNELEKINQSMGFQAGDDILKRVASILRESHASLTEAIMARLTGGDFGVFIPGVPPFDFSNIVKDVACRLGQLSAEGLTPSENVGHVGGATYKGEITLARLLAETDNALCSAIQKGINAWHVNNITADSSNLPLGQQQWKDALTQAVQEKKIRIFAQPVVGVEAGNIISHIEIFSKILQKDGELISAATFMPFAERLELVSAIDRLVIEELIKHDYKRFGVDRIAINISPSSIMDKSFLQWIGSFLEALPLESPRICFEFSEFGVIQHLESIKEFSKVVRKHGHVIGLDHYGQSFSKLSYLQSIHPDYVKIDRGYTGELKDESSDSKFFVGALCSVAHSIDIAVIAEGIENEQQAQIMKELNVDALQGFWVGKPMPIEETLENIIV